MTAGGEVKDRQRNVVAAAYSGGNSVTKVELLHYGKPPYPADTECRCLSVTKLATGTGAEPRTQTRVETAGENLQNDAVQRSRTRRHHFRLRAPDGGMRAVVGRTLK